VTRKRKKCLSSRPQDGSTDEDSEHEPVKTSNYGGGGEGRGGGEEEEEEEEEEGKRGEGEAVKGERTVTKKDKRDEREKARDHPPGEEEAGQEVGGRRSDKESRRRSALPGNQTQLRPKSFLQLNATYPRPTTMTEPPSHSRPPARRHPTVPVWICPARLPNPPQASGSYGAQQPDWNQSAPVRYRKTRGGRTRAVSMNLDLERVEVVRVLEGARGRAGVLQGSVVGPGSVQELDRVPRVRRALSSSSSSVWIDQSSPGSHPVVLRRSALDPRDRTRAWRRHTVVV